MNEITPRDKLGMQKPININISVNINRKKQNQALKRLPIQKIFNDKEKSFKDQLSVEVKPKNQFYRHTKPAQFNHQDKKNISQQMESSKESEQQRIIKKSKRVFSNFPFGKTDSLLGYQSPFQNSIMTHKRGHTTSFTKKQGSQTTKKTKNRSQGEEESIKVTGNFSSLKKKKGQLKETDLKKIISKIISSQWSRHSLNLSSGKAKQKSNFSADLTSRNLTGTKPKKKRSTKSDVLLKKQNSNFVKKRQPKNVISKEQYKQLYSYESDQVLQKLGNFKSIENSPIATQQNNDDQQQDYLRAKNKKMNPRNKIYIKTDQSIECISQIHQFQHQKFKNQFFYHQDLNDRSMGSQNGSQTHQILQNFINLLSQNQQSHSKYCIQNLEEQVPQLSPKINKTFNSIVSDSKEPESPQSLKIQNHSSPINLTQLIGLQNSRFQQQNCEQSKNQQNLFQKDFISIFSKDSRSIIQNDEEQNSKYIHKLQKQKLTLLLKILESNVYSQSKKQVLSKIQHLLDQSKDQLFYHQGKEKLKITPNGSLQQSNEKKYVEFEQYSSKNSEIIEKKNNISKETIDENIILSEKIQYFFQKDNYEYESQQNEEDLTSMNLDTIKKALKIRIRKLQEKRQKQFQKLQQHYQELKINQNQYISKKNKIQKWFRTQINQISSAQKNIWKGYQQARNYFLKDKRKQKSQQQFFQSHKKSSQQNRSYDKNAKIMKCLSQKILKTKNIKQIPCIDVVKTKQQKIKNQRKQRLNLNSSENQQQLIKTNQSVNTQKPSVVLESQISSEIIDMKNEMKKIDLFGDKRPQLFEHQNALLSATHQPIEKVIDSDNSLSKLSESSFIENNKKQQASKQLYDYEEHQSNENIQTKFSQKKTNCYVQDSEIQFVKNLQYKKLPTEQTPQNEFIESYEQDFSQKNKQIKKSITFFHNLNQDDRQDIFEFLFLDLCIEIYQDECPQNKIMNSINKFITKSYEMSKRKKGVKTNLNVVKDYLKRFCGYIMRTNKKTLSNLNTPMGPTASEMLKYMHQIEQIENDQFQDPQNAVTLIIPISIFDAFEKSLFPTIQFQPYYDNEQKEKQRVHFLKNVLHIHNKAIYDALNEFLDNQRPFGVWGKPFPWKKASSFSHLFTDAEKQQKLRKSAQKVVDSCSYVCGIMVDKQQSLIANAKVSQSYIEQIKEDRISRMLANDMMENQERWLFYDDEQTEVLVETGFDIIHKLLAECIGQMALLQKRNIQL